MPAGHCADCGGQVVASAVAAVEGEVAVATVKAAHGEHVRSVVGVAAAL